METFERAGAVECDAEVGEADFAEGFFDVELEAWFADVPLQAHSKAPAATSAASCLRVTA